MMKTSFIYIISNGTDLKIGVSKKPEKRLKQLQTGAANKLKIIETYQLPKEKIFRLEKECHDALTKTYVKRGEWFRDPLLWDVRCIVEEILDHEIV